MSDEKLDAFGWLADRSGCGHLRIMQPMDALARERGHKTAYDSRMVGSEEELPKTLVGQRVCKDGPSQLWFNIGVRKNRPRTVYELDDDLWNVDVSNHKAFNWFMNGVDDQGVVHNVHGNIARNVALSDYVTCTTEPLAELLRRFNPNVHIIPNYIPRWVLDWERPRREELCIGWGGSGTHGMDWEAEGPQIARFIKKTKTPFRLIGGTLTQAQVQLKVPVEHVSAAGWVNNPEEYWRTVDYDIGVIPLKPHIFNQSKSHLKFLENAALGIPTVASDSGPYTRAIEHGKTGFLVKRDHEWGKYLRDLVNDEAMREEIGANAKEWARTQILEDHLDEWAKVLFE